VCRPCNTPDLGDAREHESPHACDRSAHGTARAVPRIMKNTLNSKKMARYFYLRAQGHTALRAYRAARAMIGGGR